MGLRSMVAVLEKRLQALTDYWDAAHAHAMKELDLRDARLRKLECGQSGHEWKFAGAAPYWHIGKGMITRVTFRCACGATRHKAASDLTDSERAAAGLATEPKSVCKKASK
jgi:hypothetical protein